MQRGVLPKFSLADNSSGQGLDTSIDVVFNQAIELSLIRARGLSWAPLLQQADSTKGVGQQASSQIETTCRPS